jgi:hypothetical protein
VQLIEHQQASRRRPTLVEHYPAIGGHIPIEHLRARPRQSQRACQGGLPGLSGAGKKDHLACQIVLNEGSKCAFHSDYFPVDWKKVKTIFQLTGK